MANRIGTNGADNLVGTAGNDFFDAKGGNDQLTGGKGGDFLDGGEGIDTAHYEASAQGSPSGCSAAPAAAATPRATSSCRLRT